MIYTVEAGSQWIRETVHEISDGGNYDTAGITYPSITATVNWGSGFQSHSGHITYLQSFFWPSDSAPGPLRFTQYVQATGEADRQGQTGGGYAESYRMVGDLKAGNQIQADAPNENDPQFDFEENSASVSITPVDNTVTETAYVTAYASTPH